MSKRRRHRHASSPRRRDLPLAELLGIVERAKAGALSETDCATLKSAVDTLAFLTQELSAKGTTIERLRKMLFGASTEKTSQVIDDDSVTGGTAAQGGPPDASATGDSGPDKPKRPGHGRNGAAAYSGATKIKVPHPSLHGGDACPECQKGKVYLLSDPAVLVRIVGMAPLSATVYEQERLRCNLCGEVFTAPAPEGVGSEKYDETAAAMIGTVKYGAGLPFNRLERLQAGMGVPLPAATQWEIVERAADRLKPVYGELVNQGAQGSVLHNDDTPAKILELMAEVDDEKLDEEVTPETERAGPDAGTGRPERTGMFTSGIVSVVDGHRIALFFTGRKHAGENLADVLARRSQQLGAPIQMCDALAANTSPPLCTILANCLSHARRRYVDVVTDFPEECRFVLETLRAVYHNDQLARQRGLSAEDRLAFHQAESAPHMKSLEDWMKAQFEERKTEPNSGLGEAIQYTQKHWLKLTLFLRVAGAPIDNNICERILKKAILHRKNSYFFKTEHGAHVGDIFMSLIHTAELCGVQPFPYLVALLRYHEAAADDPAAWMPWNYQEALAALDPPST
jgi:transposase